MVIQTFHPAFIFPSAEKLLGYHTHRCVCVLILKIHIYI